MIHSNVADFVFRINIMYVLKLHDFQRLYYNVNNVHYANTVFSHCTGSVPEANFLNVDGAMHFIYSHKYNTNSAEYSSNMN